MVAYRAHRHGGVERAVAEVVVRIGQETDLQLIASECSVSAPHLHFREVKDPGGPAVYRSLAYDRAASRASRESRTTMTNSVDLAILDAEVITAHFCHAAFIAAQGGVRGGDSVLRRMYQKASGELFVARERRAYAAGGRLRAVIAVSQGLKRELIEHYSLEPSAISVIPNGVDRAVFHESADAQAKGALRERLGLPAHAFVPLFVGGDWDRKGLRFAIEAMANVADGLLVVVGRGDIARFEELAARRGVAERVHFAGMQLSPEEYYRAADVFLAPTLYETFSMGTLEAAASGLPLLGTRTNGIEEMIVHGVNGFFIEADGESVGARLVELRDDPALRRSMAAAAAQTAARYDWDEIARAQLAVFRQAAA
ncbi:MAG: glycosyltransferase family 4 protein [Gemmatimonadaceae bacterium]